MRARLVLIPIAVAAAFIAGCATTSPSATPTTTPAPVDNGVSAKSATEILDAAKKALADEGSFHMKGATTEDGENVDVDFKIDDKNASGIIKSQGMTIELIKVGTDVYIKADELWSSLLAANPTALALIKGKYVKVDSSDAQFGSLADLANTDDLLKPEGTFTKGEAKAINGTPAIGLVDEKDKSVLYISTVDKPLPLRIERTGGGGLDFTEFGESFDIKAPDASQVVDIGQFMPK